MKKKSRRNFIKKTSVLGAGFFIVPRNVLGGVGFTPPSDQLNIASIGSGGKGADIQNSWASKERVVALCDVDPLGKHGVIQSRKKYPKANFQLIKNNNFKQLKKSYNIVIIYGVLHLTSEWKKILKNCKNLFSNVLLFDLRETNRKTIDNKITKSYLSFNHKKNIKIPYNIINSNEVTHFLKKELNSNIYKFSYHGKISNLAKSKIQNVEFTNYCISKKKLINL